MNMDVYLSIQKVLDRALGTEVADGAGMGIVQDVALLAQRCADFRAALVAAGAETVVAAIEAEPLHEVAR